MKIQSHLKTVACAFVLCIGVCGLLCVSGCIKPDKETLARIDELETRLNHVEELLVQAQDQREMLIQKLEGMSGTLTAAQAHIQELTESRQAAVDVKLSEIAAQRDAAMTEAKETRADVEQLQGQLTQQAQEIADFKLLVTDFKLQIANLQEAITPSVDELAALTETEQAETKEPIVGFPEGADSSVTVIRGRSQN